MSDIIQKIKTIYTQVRTPRISYTRKGIRPAHDWQILLIVTILGICATCALAGYFYMQINSGSLFSTPAGDQVGGVTINQTLLKKVVDDSVARESSRADLKNNKPIPPDQSI